MSHVARYRSQFARKSASLAWAATEVAALHTTRVCSDETLQIVCFARRRLQANAAVGGHHEHEEAKVCCVTCVEEAREV